MCQAPGLMDLIAIKLWFLPCGSFHRLFGVKFGFVLGAKTGFRDICSFFIFFWVLRAARDGEMATQWIIGVKKKNIGFQVPFSHWQVEGGGSSLTLATQAQRWRFDTT
jgi:hypothetical protein